MNVTKEQHRQQKFERFKNEKINLENLDLYLYIKHAKGIPFVVVKVNNIVDVSWGYFISLLKYKAARAGKLIIEVDPKNTSKMCLLKFINSN